MLHISNLHVNVGEKEVIKGVNLKIPDHEVHALFGPNGSGKSVLISTIIGFPEYRITQGEIIFNGTVINDLEIDERVKLGIGILEQRPPTIKGVKLRDLVHIILKNREDEWDEIKILLDRFEMTSFLERNINEGFSGGEIKKSELFLLLMTRPDFIVLDEPDSGVDPVHLKLIGQMIGESLKNKEKSVGSYKSIVRKSGLLATHSAAILDYIHMDRSHILVDGKIICSGNPRIMMDQIRNYGYEYCVNCRNNKNGDDYG